VLLHRFGIGTGSHQFLDFHPAQRVGQVIRSQTHVTVCSLLVKSHRQGTRPLHQLASLIAARLAFAHEPAHDAVSALDPVLELEAGGRRDRVPPDSKCCADVIRMNLCLPSGSIDDLAPLPVVKHDPWQASQHTERMWRAAPPDRTVLANQSVSNTLINKQD
jgi:hypothetical protein